MSRTTRLLSTSQGRTLGVVFLLLLAMLSYFSLTAAAGVGGLGIYVVTSVQMLVLAAIVALYAFAVAFLDQEEEHG